MPNEMLDNMEFENQLNKLGDNQIELIKFVARQQFESTQLLTTHEQRIGTLETGDRKTSGIVGGVSGALTGAIIGIINYFSNK